MRLLLALALAMGCLAAPAAARDNPARDLTRTGIPGAVVLSHDGVHAAGNVRADDRFRVGSVTKTFVSAVVLQLVAERRLSLDEPVPEAGGVPLRTLLNHTSGIYNHSDDPRVFEHGLLTRWQPQRAGRDLARAPAVLRARRRLPLLEHELRDPRPGDRARDRPAARGLERRSAARLPDTAYEESPRVRRLAPGPRQNTSWAGASGALVSTARDLDRFYRALLRSPLAATMQTLDPVAGPYGLGLFKVQASCGWFWGHNGAVPGYLAHAYTDGKRSAVVLVTGDAAAPSARTPRSTARSTRPCAREERGARPAHGEQAVPAAARRGDAGLAPDHQLDRKGALHAVAATGDRAGALLRKDRGRGVRCRLVTSHAAAGGCRRSACSSARVMFGAFAIGGDVGQGAFSFRIMAALGALFAFGRRSETLQGLGGPGRDERWAMIDLRATALAGVGHDRCS